MNKEELISRVSDSIYANRNDVTLGFNKCLEIITEVLQSGEQVTLRGFGTFKPKQRAARIARNPHTNEEINVPAKIVPVFVASDSFKKKMEEI